MRTLMLLWMSAAITYDLVGSNHHEQLVQFTASLAASGCHCKLSLANFAVQGSSVYNQHEHLQRRKEQFYQEMRLLHV